MVSMFSLASLVDTKRSKNNRPLEAAFQRAGLDDISSHNLRKTFATRLLNRGATDYRCTTFCWGIHGKDNREGICSICKEWVDSGRRLICWISR